MRYVEAASIFAVGLLSLSFSAQAQGIPAQKEWDGAVLRLLESSPKPILPCLVENDPTYFRKCSVWNVYVADEFDEDRRLFLSCNYLEISRDSFLISHGTCPGIFAAFGARTRGALIKYAPEIDQFKLDVAFGWDVVGREHFEFRYAGGDVWCAFEGSGFSVGCFDLSGRKVKLQ